MQSWVSKSTIRSVSDEPESMQMAAENRRRIMGSSLFGGDSNQYQSQQQNLSKTAPLSKVDEEYTPTQAPLNQYSLSSTLPSDSNSNFGYEPFSSALGKVSDFPELNFDTEPPPPISSASDLGFRPKQLNYRQNGNFRRLQVPPNQQMRQLRDELNRETEKFNHKLRQIGQT